MEDTENFIHKMGEILHIWSSNLLSWRRKGFLNRTWSDLWEGLPCPWSLEPSWEANNFLVSYFLWSLFYLLLSQFEDTYVILTFPQKMVILRQVFHWQYVIPYILLGLFLICFQSVPHDWKHTQRSFLGIITKNNLFVILLQSLNS